MRVVVVVPFRVPYGAPLQQCLWLRCGVVVWSKESLELRLAHPADGIVCFFFSFDFLLARQPILGAGGWWVWSEGLGGEGWGRTAAVKEQREGVGRCSQSNKRAKKKRRWMKENEQKKKKKRESESRRNEQPWSSKRDEPKKTAGNGRRPQYQSMVQARELELATPSFAACAVAGVPHHQQTGGRQQRPQAELAVQQVVRWSVALRWSFVQVRRLQRRRLVRRTDEPPLRLSRGLQKSG